MSDRNGMPSRRIGAMLLIALPGALLAAHAGAAKRPNILFAISDDQSYPHASAYGDKAAITPAFDRVAKEGVLFMNAFSSTPGCSPTRASVLTGYHSWQIEHAGTHASSFSKKYHTFPDLLEKAGYWVGYTGKPWGPGNWKAGGRARNPAGPAFTKKRNKPPHKGMNGTDYAANFADFLKRRPKGRPFCFWYGASEPHRSFAKGAGLKEGKKLADADVPPFLPDTPEVRSDILDYAVEIEWFDTHLGRILKQIEEAGELDNTLVIVTSDNGMAFPRAKANLYEFGTHMPLAIRWGGKVPGGRTVTDLVGFVDLTATILDAAGVKHPENNGPLPGRSLMNVLTSERSGLVDPSRDAVFCARERHSSSRYLSLSYPQRSIRTHRHLYIRNFKPERWPAGPPRKYGTGRKKGKKPAGKQKVLGPMHGGYHDIDGCPTLSYLIQKADDPKLGKYLQLSVAHRPAEELFDIVKDPGCLNNLAGNPEFENVRAKLWARLETALKKTGDARVSGNGDIWETYERYSHLRDFPVPEWAKKNPASVPPQEWHKRRVGR